MLKTQRNYGDKCGLGFKKKMTKGERERERERERKKDGEATTKKALSYHVLPMS